ncbi:MAG: nitroreductase family protein [Bacillota bacterium]|nr:nitroreductase family protein [Bacillota bacterium]
MNEILNTIKSRRSVRSYRKDQIRQEELDAIIEAAIYAPTGHNEQPWHFTVVQNQDTIQYINDKAKELMVKSDVEWIRNTGSRPMKITYDAPTLVIVSGRADAISWRADCAAAIQNMLIAAESLDIGSVWLGLVNFFFEQEDAAKILGIPEGYEPYYTVALGYKASDRKQAAPARNYDVVNYIR